MASFGDVTGLNVIGSLPGVEVKGCVVAGTDVIGALMLNVDVLGLDLALRSRMRMRTSTGVVEACCEKRISWALLVTWKVHMPLRP